MPNLANLTISQTTFLASAAVGSTVATVTGMSAPIVVPPVDPTLAGVNSLLTKADFGNPGWWDNRTLLRFKPWVLANPIRPGETKKVDGTNVVEKISQSNRTPTIDANSDLFVIGARAFEGPTPPTGTVQVTGAANQRWIGIDVGARKIVFMGFTESLYVEGLRGSFALGEEGDLINFRGLVTDDSYDPNLPAACFQNISMLGGHGSNRDHRIIPGDVTSGQNSVALTDLRQISSNTIQATLASAPPGLTQPYASFTASVAASVSGAKPVMTVTELSAGHKIGKGMLVNYTGQPSNQYIWSQLTSTEPDGALGMRGTYELNYQQPTPVTSRTMTARAWEFGIGGAQIAGLTSVNGTGFNQSWDFVSYDVTTRTLVLQAASFSGAMPNTISGLGSTVATSADGVVTGATLWVMNAIAGEHGDGIQDIGSINSVWSLEVHNLSVESSYCGIIAHGNPQIELTNYYYRINFANAPMDNGTEFMRLSTEAMPNPFRLRRVANSYAEVRPTNTLANMSPTVGNGAVVRVLNGTETLTWTRADFRGGVERKAPPYGDPAPYAEMGFDYTANDARYEGLVSATATGLLDLTISATPAIPESATAGTILGILSLSHNFGRHSAVIDYSISSSNVLVNQWFIEGCYLQVGKTQFDYETTPLVGGVRTATVTIRATISGTSEYIERTFSFPVTNDVSASGLTVTAANTAHVEVGAPSATTSTPYASVSVGTAAASRYVVAFLAGWSSDPARLFNATQSLTGATNGAKSMTKLAAQQGGKANNNYAQAALYIADLPADTTAAMSVGSSSALTAQGLGVFNVTGLSARTPYSYSSNAIDTVGAQVAMQIDIPAQGVAVLGCAYGTSTSNNKCHTGARLTSSIAATYYVRFTPTPGSAAAGQWAYSTDGSNWTNLASDYNSLIEGSGAAGSVIVGASFGPAT